MKKTHHIDITIFGTRHRLTFRVSSEEEIKSVEKARDVIASMEKYINRTYHSMTREKKLALLVMYIAVQAIKERERLIQMQEKLKSLDILVEYIKSPDEGE